MMDTLTRRQFVASTPVILCGSSILSAGSNGTDAEGYEVVAARTWRPGPLASLEGAALGQELVRCATLAPSSHNTKCWKFAVQDTAITILPDLSRRCPAASVRPRFAAAVSLTGQRPDQVVRFGRGSALPASLRQPVQAVLV